jgi:hypothetical protein
MNLQILQNGHKLIISPPKNGLKGPPRAPIVEMKPICGLTFKKLESSHLIQGRLFNNEYLLSLWAASDLFQRDKHFETFEKRSFLFKFKHGEDFNHRNTFSILRNKI